MYFVICSQLFVLFLVYGWAEEVPVMQYISGNTGRFTSPGYPGTYPNNVNYTWILTTGYLTANVTFTFDNFDIYRYRYEPCTDDYLEITEQEPCCFVALKRCGDIGRFNMTVTGNVIRIKFVSNERDTAMGFSLQWKVALPKSKSTTETTTKTTLVRRTTIVTLGRTRTIPVRTTTTPITTTTTVSTTTTTPITTTTTVSTTTTPVTTTTSARTTTSVTTTTGELTSTIHTSTTPITFISSSSEIQTSVSTNEKEKEDSSTSPVVFTGTPSNESSTTPEDTEDTSLSPHGIVFLAVGICIVEITLIALGVCMGIQRRKRASETSTFRRNQNDNIRPVSRKTIFSVNNVYESIPLEHFSDDTIQEEEEVNPYACVAENVYDKAFVKRPHVGTQNNLYEWN